MSLFSFLKTSQEEFAIVLEIGSGSIGGTLVRFSHKTKPEIFYGTRQQISFQRELSSDELTKQMVVTLDKVCSLIQKEGLTRFSSGQYHNFKITKVYVILSSPWCLTQTKIVDYNPGQEFFTDKKFLNKLYKDQEALVLAESQKSLNNIAQGIKIIENSTIQIRLNGYQVVDILNRRAKTLTLATLVTAAPEEILNKITETTRKHFSLSGVGYYSFGLTSFTVARDFYPEKESFIFMDLSSELTELSMVRDEVLMAGTTFPLGRNHFVRHLAEGLSVSVEEAFSLLNIYHSNNLDAEFTKKVESILDQAMVVWSKAMSETLERLSKEIYIPRTIFKVTNDDFGYYFAKKLSEVTFSQMGFTDERFNVVAFDRKVASSRCDVSFSAKVDTFMYINCLFLNKLYNLKK
ncbi:MAG: hypothetical protein WCF94_04265 [bacterium]